VGRKADVIQTEWEAWLADQGRRTLTRGLVYFLIAAVACVLAYFNIIFGIRFTANLRRAWLTSVFVGCAAGAWPRGVTPCLRPTLCSSVCALTLATIADALFVEPVSLLINVFIDVLLAFSNEPAEKVVFQPLKIVFSGAGLIEDVVRSAAKPSGGGASGSAQLNPPSSGDGVAVALSSIDAVAAAAAVGVGAGVGSGVGDVSADRKPDADDAEFKAGDADVTRLHIDVDEDVEAALEARLAAVLQEEGWRDASDAAGGVTAAEAAARRRRRQRREGILAGGGVDLDSPVRSVGSVDAASPPGSLFPADGSLYLASPQSVGSDAAFGENDSVRSQMSLRTLPLPPTPPGMRPKRPRRRRAHMQRLFDSMPSMP
jgi:hypothetical protein